VQAVTGSTTVVTSPLVVSPLMSSGRAKTVPCSLSLSRRVPRCVGPRCQHHRGGHGPGLLGPIRLRNLFSFLFLFLFLFPDLMQRFENPYLEF
jgi:hypothetical protein